MKPEVEIDVDGVALATWHRQQSLARAEREITCSEWIISEPLLSSAISAMSRKRTLVACVRNGWEADIW